MGGISDSIGSIAVQITADYSDLQTKLDAATAEAQAGAEQIATSFTAAAEGTDAWAQAVETLVAGGHTLAEAMTLATASTADLTAAAADAGAATTQTAEQLALFGEAAAVPFADASGQLNLFTDELEVTAPALQKVTVDAEAAAKPIKDLEDNAVAGSGALDSLAATVGKLAVQFGLIIGAKQFLTDTFTAFTQLEDATNSMTALTGSASIAAAQIERIRDLATSQNLSFPALLEATQRMDAFGFSTQLIDGALQAAADASVATNKSIEQVTAAMERMAAAGMAGGRQLVAVGLTTHDLATAMGVLDTDVTKTFKSLDQSTRLELVSLALKKFEGDSEATTGNLSRQWQGVKNEFTKFFSDLGALLEPAAKALLTFFSSVADAAKLWVDVIRVSVERVEVLFIRIVEGAEAARKKIAELAQEEAKREAQAPTGPPTPVFTQASFAKQFNQDLNLHQWDDASKLIQQLAQTDLPAAQKAMQTLVEKEWEYNESLKVHKEHLDRLKPITDNYTGSLAILTAQYEANIKVQKELTSEIATYRTQQEELGRTLSESAATGEYFFNIAVKSADAIAKIGTELPPVIDAYGNLVNANVELSASLLNTSKEIQGVNSFLDAIEGHAKPAVDALQQALAKIDKELAAGHMSNLVSEINKLATMSLPDAVSKSDELLKAQNDLNVSTEQYGKILKQNMELHLQSAEAAGESTTRLQTQLGLLDLTTKNVGYDTQRVFGTVAVQAMNEMDKALSKVGSNFAKVIVEGGSGVKVLMGLLQQFAESILSTVINAIVKWGEQMVLNAVLSHITSSTEAIGQVINAAGVAFANAYAATAAIPIIGPALAPGVAAASEAAVLAGGLPLASAAQGAVFGTDTIVQAHAEEMILPASLSNGLQDLIANNQTGGSQSNGLTIAIQNMHGVTRDTVDALATSIMRKARLVGAFR